MQQATSYRAWRYCVRLVRVRGWWDKFCHLAGSAFLLWLYSDRIRLDVAGLVLYLTGVVCLLVGGYTMNDVADSIEDAALDGKEVVDRRHSLIVALAALVTGLALMLATTSDVLPRLIAGATIVIGVEYSLPPLRFKERGIWGLVVGSATQKPALFLILVATLGAWNWLSLVLTVWLFFGGMLGMLGHQLLDYRNDLRSNVRTFTVRNGPRLATLLSMVCVTLIITSIVAPLAFVGLVEALPVMCLLAAFSSVYAVKGLRAAKTIRETVIG